MHRAYTDKLLEQARYERRAIDQARCLDNAIFSTVETILPPLRQPYLDYNHYISNLSSQNSNVLELCAGMGENTQSLIKSSSNVVVTDISQASLEVLASRFPEAKGLKTLTCDMEQLPFESNTFDLIVCAGGLGYGDNSLVMSEIHRCLKHGSYFVCVDSLNHNIVYRINRYIHFLMGRRTFSVLRRLPTLALINAYQERFSSVTVNYYGIASWLFVLLSKLGFSHFKLLAASNTLDTVLKVRRNAFKFVMVAQK